MEKVEKEEKQELSCCQAKENQPHCENQSCCEDQVKDETLFQLDGQKNQYRYDVVGMDCGSCAQTIKKGVEALAGVQKVQVNFSTGKMIVQTSSRETAEKEVVKRVTQLGYSAVLEGAKSTEKQSLLSSKAIILLSTIFFIGGFAAKLWLSLSWAANLFFGLTMVIAGAKTFRSAWFSLKAKSLDMNVLMASAAIGAVLLGEWSEGATILYLFVIGVFLQNKAVEKTRRSIQEMMSLAPDVALVQESGEWVERKVENIQVGERILVRSGDKIPLDGVIKKGTTEVNQSAITGESIPITKTIGSDVYAGSINESGTIEIQITKTADESTIAKVIEMVEEAQERKAPSEAFIDRFARVYTPIVFIGAVLMMVIPPIFGADLRESVFKGIELLIVACPCALVISTPVSIVSALGNAARNGVLIKGGIYLETAAKTTAIAFDKTGTITAGMPKVTGVNVLDGSMDEIMTMAYNLEKNATHPIAKAIKQYAQEKGAKSLPVETEKNIIGKGMMAQIRGKQWQIGSSQLFSVSKEQLALKKSHENKGQTVIFIGKHQKVWAMIFVQDDIRLTSVKAVEQLKRLGMQKLIMLTGDNRTVAENITGKAGLTGYRAEMMPKDKADKIQELQKKHVTAMVGDGINDAPALAVSDLGIAMGGVGTDAAMETADIVLLADNLEQLPFIFRLGKRTVRIIKQNVYCSLLVKAIAFIFIFAGWLPIWLAVLSDTGMAVLVTLNALRLSRRKK